MLPRRPHWLSRLATIVAGAVLPVVCYAQTTGPNEPVPIEPSHPSLVPQQFLWPGVVVIVLIAIFVAAALAGPLIRANQDDDTDERDGRS